MAWVEVIYGLYQPYAAHLKKVIHILSPGGKALDNRQNKPQIALYKLLPGPFISVAATPQQFIRLTGTQHRQTGSVHTAYFYFSLQKEKPLPKKILP